MILIAILALALVGVTVTLLARASALPRMQAVERLGQISAYGSPRTAGSASVRRSASAVDKLASRVGGIVAGALGAREADLRRHLMAAGVYRISTTALLGYRVLAAVTMPMLVIVAAPPNWPGALRLAAAALSCWGGWALPLVVLQRRARVRLEDIDSKLPSMIDLLVVTVEAGLGFSTSLQLAADKLTGPLGDELRLMLQEQRMGLATREALKNMAARSDTPGMRTFVRAIVQGEELGVSIGHIMRSLAGDMRKLRRSMAEERAQKAPVKILFPLVFLIFPSLFILLLGPAVLQLIEAFGGM